jgi:predicted solute-binding protein
MIKPRYSREEVVELGEAAFERDVAAKLSEQDLRNFVAIDVNTGAFEVDADEGRAIRRLLDRNPGTQFWLRRVGSSIAHSFGPRIEYQPPSV